MSFAYDQLESICLSSPESFETKPQRRPIVYIYSEHPLARRAIEGALTADRSLSGSIRPAPQITPCTEKLDHSQVPIFDICSIDNWPELLFKWNCRGASPVALLPLDHSSHAEQLRVLYMGVRGIVTLSADLDRELPRAVHSVANGQLWISRDTLSEYVKQNSLLSARLPAEAKRFTAREEQVVKFIIRGFSNKQIGSLLGISERTVKFHVSNILQKSEVHSREGLLQKLAPA